MANMLSRGSSRGARKAIDGRPLTNRSRAKRHSMRRSGRK